MYLRQKKVLINELNVWFDKQTKEVKGLVVLYDNGLQKVFLWNAEEVKKFFWLENLPKTDEDMKNLRRELKENWEWKKITKSTIYGELELEGLDYDTIQ